MTFGQYPIAIATSLAFEGLAGIYPDRPVSPAPILKYTDVIINVRTIIRNILESVEGNITHTILQQCKNQLRNELIGIPRIIESISNGKVKTSFYYCNMKNVPRMYKTANFYQAITDRQKAMLMNTNSMIAFLRTELKDEHEIHWADEYITLKTDRTLMLSHLPIDILHAKTTNTLSLIESHTGVIKQSTHFYTKLKDGKTLTMIPFDRMTIQMFGDSGGMFMPRPIKFRTRLLQYARDKHWNTSWTKDMVIRSMDDRKEPWLLEEVKQLYR